MSGRTSLSAWRRWSSRGQSPAGGLPPRIAQRTQPGRGRGGQLGALFGRACEPPTRPPSPTGTLSYVGHGGGKNRLRASTPFVGRYVATHLMRPLISAVEAEFGPFNRLRIESRRHMISSEEDRLQAGGVGIEGRCSSDAGRGARSASAAFKGSHLSDAAGAEAALVRHEAAKEIDRWMWRRSSTRAAPWMRRCRRATLSPLRAGGVDRIAQRAEVRALGLEPLEPLEQVAQRAREAVDPDHHQHVVGPEPAQEPPENGPAGAGARRVLLVNLGASCGPQLLGQRALSRRGEMRWPVADDL